MWHAMQNPPLCSCFIASVASFLVGVRLRFMPHSCFGRWRPFSARSRSASASVGTWISSLCAQPRKHSGLKRAFPAIRASGGTTARRFMFLSPRRCLLFRSSLFRLRHQRHVRCHAPGILRLVDGALDSRARPKTLVASRARDAFRFRRRPDQIFRHHSFAAACRLHTGARPALLATIALVLLSNCRSRRLRLSEPGAVWARPFCQCGLLLA